MIRESLRNLLYRATYFLHVIIRAQNFIGNGGAVDSSRGYVVELDALSTTCSIPTQELPGDSMQTTLHSLLHCIDCAEERVPLHNDSKSPHGRITEPLHPF